MGAKRTYNLLCIGQGPGKEGSKIRSIQLPSAFPPPCRNQRTMKNRNRIRLKFLEKSWKFEARGCPRGSWARSWSHFGFQGDARQKKHCSLTIPCHSQGSPRGSKIDPKPFKNLTKNRANFYYDFERILKRFRRDFAPHEHPK